MAPLRKHGAHLHSMMLPKLAAGSATDTSASWHYSEFASDLGVSDPTQMWALDMAMVGDAAVTGAATNNFAVTISHYDNANTLKNQLVYTFASGTNLTAFTPIGLHAITGALTNPTGVPLPWALKPGDTINMQRTSSNATGLASPALTVNTLVGANT